MADKPWPAIEDVAARLRQPLSAFTPAEQDQLTAMLDSAVDECRLVPDYRGPGVELIPPRVWDAVVGLAALGYWIANPTVSAGDPDVSVANPASRRYQLLMQMGRGRGGKPRAR